MESFSQATGFRYNLDSNRIAGDDAEFSGILEIYAHHARNLHNICIYEKQDVYAKFSLTYNPDETLSTRIINGGGKNPDFNENLRLKITQIEAVLKCEIWMHSRARNYMEDQLLGFTLVPISQVIGKGKVTRDYSLSSTDLFHSPAGTVQLTLSLIPSLPIKSSANSSITSEVVLLDRKISEEVMLHPLEYSSIEFPDINVVSQNQQMVTEYFDLAKHKHGSEGLLASFLRLGASPDQDYEMIVSSSPNESIHNSGFLSSTTSSMSDDRNNNSADSMEKKSRLASVTNGAANQNCAACPDTPTSRKGREASSGDEKLSFMGKQVEVEVEGDEEMKKENKDGSGQFGRVYSAPLGNMNSDAEQTAMQQQIVDMYMRSMQQFTESLANMKLPMDLDKPEREDHGEVIPNNKLELEKKKDGSRVFYGSRAFF